MPVHNYITAMGVRGSARLLRDPRLIGMLDTGEPVGSHSPA